MSPSNADLIAFLETRIDEDGAAAFAAARADCGYRGRPNWSPLGGRMVTDSEDPDWGIVDLSPCIEDGDLAAHIARHDPARALREVAAKRAILPGHDDNHDCADLSGTEFPYVGCSVVRHLAAVYSDHPDYDTAWSPTAAPAQAPRDPT